MGSFYLTNSPHSTHLTAVSENTVPAPLTMPGRRGGTLKRGNPGNKGSRGLTERVRHACALAFEERVPTLALIADDKEAGHADRIKAVDVLGKYGLGTLKEVSVENVRERLGQTLDVIRQQLPPEQADTLIAALRTVWG